MNKILLNLQNEKKKKKKKEDQIPLEPPIWLKFGLIVLTFLEILYYYTFLPSRLEWDIYLP